MNDTDDCFSLYDTNFDWDHYGDDDYVPDDDNFTCGSLCHDCKGCHHTCKCYKNSAPRRKRVEQEIKEMRKVDEMEYRSMLR